MHKWFVYDVDFKTGKIRWQREVQQAAPTQPRHQKNSLASETPTTDGERVYAYFSNAGLFAFDMNGKPVWSKPMDAVKVRSGWGGAASPVVHKGRVYIVNDNDERSFIAAHDARTGAEVWRVPRDEGSNWTTPFIWEHAQRTEIVTAGDRQDSLLRSERHAPLGAEGHVRDRHPDAVREPRAAVHRVWLPGDKLRPVYAIRPGASGDISLKEGETSNQFVAWSDPALGTYNTSPLVYGDYYYTLLDRGLLICHDAENGQGNLSAAARRRWTPRRSRRRRGRTTARSSR